MSKKDGCYYDFQNMLNWDRIVYNSMMHFKLKHAVSSLCAMTIQNLFLLNLLLEKLVNYVEEIL